MAMFMKVTGIMIKQKVMAFTLIKMALYTKVTGKKTSNMEKEKRHGQTKQCIKETI